MGSNITVFRISFFLENFVIISYMSNLRWFKKMHCQTPLKRISVEKTWYLNHILRVYMFPGNFVRNNLRSSCHYGTGKFLFWNYACFSLFQDKDFTSCLGFHGRPGASGFDPKCLKVALGLPIQLPNFAKPVKAFFRECPLFTLPVPVTIAICNSVGPLFYHDRVFIYIYTVYIYMLFNCRGQGRTEPLLRRCAHWCPPLWQWSSSSCGSCARQITFWSSTPAAVST